MVPTPYTLLVREPTPGPVDEFGNASETWETRGWVVHGVAPGAMTEPEESNRDLSVVAFTVLAPAGAIPGERAQVQVDGTWFDVDGRPRDYSRGPWDFPEAGVTVELRYADG